MSAARVVEGKLKGADFLQDARVQRVFETLASPGEETRAVGGAIRNALMGIAVHEVDFATTLEPPAIIACAQAAGLRSIPTGIEHGTVTLLIGGVAFEVTTLRSDVETDGRYARVRFGRSFEEDALRRDFTFNALSVTRDGTLFDYTQGADDIGRRHVRFIGDARQRIREDYLRILRFFRFHAAYGAGPMNREAFEAAIQEHAGLERLSRERVRSELLKLLAAKRCADVIGDVAGAGILGPILAGVAHPARLAKLVRIEASLEEDGDALLRLAALSLLIPEDADRLLDHLRLSNAERDRLAAAARVLAKLHSPDALDEQALRVRHYRGGRQAVLDALRLAWASDVAQRDENAWRAAIAFVTQEPERKLSVGGADLIRRGLTPGPALGVALAEIERRWIETGFPEGELVDALVEAAMAGLRPRPPSSFEAPASRAPQDES